VAPPETTRDEAGEGGRVGDIDLRTLMARVEQCQADQERINRRQDNIDARYDRLVERLKRLARFTDGELAHLELAGD
jgi:hypothetical protein